MKTIAIVASAGGGKRLGLKVKKPFVALGRNPIVSYSLKVLDASRAIDAIIIASERSCVKRFEMLVDSLSLRKVIGIVRGGKTRADSVRNCLEKVPDSFGIVLIQDGARPFLDERMIRGSIDLAKRFGACIVAVPEKDTVKLAGKDLFTRKTLDRNKIFRAQTPQTFRLDLIRKAYALKMKSPVTDDASLVEALGKRVKILEGSYRNMKITTKEDLKFAEVLL